MSHDSEARDQHRPDDDTGRGGDRPGYGGPGQAQSGHGRPGGPPSGGGRPGDGQPGDGHPGAPPWNPPPGQPWGPETGAFWAPQWGPQWGPGWMSPQAAEGRRHAEHALVLGILSVVVLPLLGPFALWQAREAEKLGISATAGKVLGWVGTVMIAVFLIFLLLWLVAFGFIVMGSAAGA